MKTQSIKIKLILPAKTYSDAFKKNVVQEYESGLLNKDELQRKYGIGGSSCVLTWCRLFGKLHYPEKGITTGRPMKDPRSNASRN